MFVNFFTWLRARQVLIAARPDKGVQLIYSSRDSVPKEPTMAEKQAMPFSFVSWW
jgi:hypothetical protein